MKRRKEKRNVTTHATIEKTFRELGIDDPEVRRRFQALSKSSIDFCFEERRNSSISIRNNIARDIGENNA